MCIIKCEVLTYVFEAGPQLELIPLWQFEERVPAAWAVPSYGPGRFTTHRQARKLAGSKSARKEASRQARKQARKKARKEGRKEASKPVSQQASKQASKHASDQASQQTSQQASNEAMKQPSIYRRKQASK